MKKCIVCQAQVDWAVVIEEFEWVFDQADALGVESLTEQAQCVYEGLVCSHECFDALE